jgi:hypothetical protein
MTRQITQAELHAYAFVRLTGIKVHTRHESGYWLCEHKKRFFTLSPEQVHAFSRQFSWLTSGIGEVNPLPEIGGKTHVDVRLRECPLKQYLACENYYQAYLFTKDTDWLCRLAAAFYTSGNTFNDNEAFRQATDFQKIPFHILHTVFLWYYGLKSVMQTRFPNFFQKVETILEEDEPQAPDMLKQINNIVRTLSGGDVTKTEAVYNTETWAALAELDAKALEYKELERRMNKIRK